MKAVARSWAEGRGGGRNTAGDPLTEAYLQQQRKGGPLDRTIDLPEEDEPAVRLFLAMSTQWRVEGFSGRRLGMDYAVLPATAEMLGIARDPATFHALRIMEAEALSVFASTK